MAYFFCRLNPPRPTFMQDMTPDEQQLMMQHVGYWKAVLDQGKVLVYGPVGDPKGGWGLAVVKMEDLAEVERFTAADPVILAKKNFSYDILPMVRAIVPA